MYLVPVALVICNICCDMNVQCHQMGYVDQHQACLCSKKARIDLVLFGGVVAIVLLVAVV
jgi:hypothetical protein